ncbi:MAG: ATP-dependent helicase HrpB [Gammaproteobacteria bacterium]
MASGLPVDEIIPELTAALRTGNAAVLQAPPGAGKTTRVPLALLQEPWLNGKGMLMLEPRRLAARSASYYMARQLGEPPGETVGYRMRRESRVSNRTRIEVVTEGVLTRLLQDDPALTGVGLVIFDEFHERSLHADLGLALCMEVQAALRDDLRLLVMSATLDGAAVSTLLGHAPILTSSGRSFPVDTRYLPPDGHRATESAFLAHVAAAVKRALTEETGSVLVFLPGVAEIKRVEHRLREARLGPEIHICPLYGELGQDAQEQAILPAASGERKTVLATAIAETSLTIEGIRIVIDSGLARGPRFDPVSGLIRLTTMPASQASAEQRRGRAGRLEAGVCYRLWSEDAHQRLPGHSRPEILEADLASLALDIAQWGIGDPGKLAWLDPPPAAHYAQARELLQELGALDHEGAITPHGRRMAQLAMHPRLAHMVLMGMQQGHGALACDLAALLSERDISKGERDADVHLRLQALHTDWPSPLTLPQRERGSKQMDMHIDGAACARVRKQAEQWRRQLRIANYDAGQADHSGVLLGYAYPDRIARRRPGGEPRYLLANGRGAFFPRHEPLSAAEFIVAAQLDGAHKEARIFLATAISRAALEEYFSDLMTLQDYVAWDGREECVQARRRRRLGALVLDAAPLDNADPQTIIHAMVDGIRAMGIGSLPWSKGLRSWQQRVQFLHRLEPQQWPDVSDEHLRATLEDWLAPYLNGITRRTHLPNLNLHAALTDLLSWEQQRTLEELAPTHLTVPSGSRVPIDYAHEIPVLAVRLQEMFGSQETPRIAGGRMALLIHLLSPARRPVQVTQDLAGFWARSYHEVKKDLKGRYPKHYWPDDPLQAQPTARAKPRASS